MQSHSVHDEHSARVCVCSMCIVGLSMKTRIVYGRGYHKYEPYSDAWWMYIVNVGCSNIVRCSVDKLQLLPFSGHSIREHGTYYGVKCITHIDYVTCRHHTCMRLYRIGQCVVVIVSNISLPWNGASVYRLTPRPLMCWWTPWLPCIQCICNSMVMPLRLLLLHFLSVHLLASHKSIIDAAHTIANLNWHLAFWPERLIRAAVSRYCYYAGAPAAVLEFRFALCIRRAPYAIRKNSHLLRR